MPNTENRRWDDAAPAKMAKSIALIIESLILAGILYIISSDRQQSIDLATIKANSENTKLIISSVPALDIRLTRQEAKQEALEQRVKAMEQMRELQ